jgi:electron transfer flavoprotein beta subunit
MHIIVCMKQVPDHEGTRENYAIDHDQKRVEPRGIPPVVSLFDENALEAALRIKDALEHVKITILSIGKRISDAVMLRVLAAGADELVKVEDERFAPEKLDSWSTARIIAEAIKRIGDYDLILVGRQASDWNNGYMGIGLGGILNIPCVTFAQNVDIQSGLLIVNRVLEDGHEIIKSELPAVVVVSNELGELRYPPMKERRKAKNKPIHSWSGKDIALNEPIVSRLESKRLYYPELKTTTCTYIESDSPVQAGRHLAEILFKDNVLE